MKRSTFLMLFAIVAFSIAECAPVSKAKPVVYTHAQIEAMNQLTLIATTDDYLSQLERAHSANHAHK